MRHGPEQPVLARSEPRLSFVVAATKHVDANQRSGSALPIAFLGPQDADEFRIRRFARARQSDNQQIREFPPAGHYLDDHLNDDVRRSDRDRALSGVWTARC